MQPAGLRRASLQALLFLVPAAAATAVGLWAFTHVPLSNDEAVTVGVAGRSLPQIIDTIRHVDAVHGVYYLLMHFVVAPFGAGTATVRLPSLIGTAVAAGLLALLGQMLRSWRAGLLAGLLFACSPAASEFAQDARPYGIVYPLVVAMTMALVAALTGRRRVLMWLLYGLALLASVALHLFVLLMLPAYAIPVGLVAVRERNWRPAAVWAGVSVVALVPLVPLVRLIEAQKGTAAWIRPPGWRQLFDTGVTLSGGSFLLIAGALLVVFAYGQGGPRKLSAFEVAAPWLLVPPLLLLVVSRFEPLYAFRYIAFCAPALALLGGVSLDRLATAWRYGAWLAIPATAVLVVASLPANTNVRFHPVGVASVNDLRSVAAFLTKNQVLGDGVIYTAPGQRYLSAAYPGPYHALQDVALNQTPAASDSVSGTDVDGVTLAGRLARFNRVWTIKYFIWSGGEASYRAREASVFAALHKAGFRWQYTKRIHYTAIALWVRPPPTGG